MPRAFHVALALPTLLLAACANFSPKSPPPEAANPIPIYFADRLPSEMEKVAQYSIPNSYFGATTTKRGSLAVGLMFGPLGVMANMAYVQEQARKASAGGGSLFEENLPRLIGGEQARYPTIAAADRGGAYYEVIPSVVIHFESDTEYTFTCNTWVSRFAGREEVWKGRYASSPGRVYSTEMLGSDAAVRGDIRTCLVTTLALFDLHRTSGPESYRKAEIKAEIWLGDVTFYGPVVSALLPDRVVYNDPAGLWEIDKRQLRALKLE